MNYGGTINLFDNSWELSLEQYRESPKLKGLVNAVIGNGQPFEEAIGRCARWANIGEAEGAWMDLIGEIRNIPRNPGESDDDYRERMLQAFKIDTAGTPDNVIANASDMSGDPKPQYMDESPATFFIYTPQGRQIARKKLQSLAPAGVLALPGAALRTVSGGDFIVTGEGKRILAVARDLESMGLVAETGELILTENGERIMTEGT